MNQSEESKQSEIFQSFSSLLKVECRPFGQKNKSVFGVSDGNKGVQWNLGIYKNTDNIKLGVNLEGSQATGLWLITSFILSELENPTIEALKTRLNLNLDDVSVKFDRDAWQKASRLNIVEQYLGGRRFYLSKINTQLWQSILKEALTCLDKNKEYKGRNKKQLVTLSNSNSNSNEKVEKEVSPHLTIQIKIINYNLQEGIEKLKPIYNWVNDRCGVRN